MKEKGTSDNEAGILSSASSATVLLKQGPPDGGTTAWLQVMGAFFMYFNTWGIVSSYGTYQVVYEGSLLSNASTFQVSTIGSVQSFVMVFLGFFSGPLFDKGYFRLLLRIGSWLIIVGTILQGFCTEYWHLLLSQGLCVGLGMGCLAVPSVAVASSWFTSKLPLANGIIVSASGFGGVVYPIMIRSLIPLVGFKFTSLCVALVIVSTLGFSNLVLQQPSTSPTKRGFVDKSAFSDVPYVLFVFGCVCVFLGLYTPFFYVATYAVKHDVATQSIATYFVTVLNAASVFGRILPNIPNVTLLLGPLNMMAVSMFSLALLVLCVNAHGIGLAGLLVILVLYGFFTGAFFSLQPTIFARLTQDKSRIGTRIGMASTCMSFGLLIGAPAGGALIRVYGYHAGWAWSGAAIALGTMLVVGSRGLAGGWKLASSI